MFGKSRMMICVDNIQNAKYRGAEWGNTDLSGEDAYKLGWNDALDTIYKNAEAIAVPFSWIPCADMVPDDDEPVLCTTETKKGYRQVVKGYYDVDTGHWKCGMNSNVIAWMPMPTEYIGDLFGKLEG